TLCLNRPILSSSLSSDFNYLSGGRRRQWRSSVRWIGFRCFCDLPCAGRRCLEGRFGAPSLFPRQKHASWIWLPFALDRNDFGTDPSLFRSKLVRRLARALSTDSLFSSAAAYEHDFLRYLPTPGPASVHERACGIFSGTDAGPFRVFPN